MSSEVWCLKKHDTHSHGCLLWLRSSTLFASLMGLGTALWSWNVTCTELSLCFYIVVLWWVSMFTRSPGASWKQEPCLFNSVDWWGRIGDSSWGCVCPPCSNSGESLHWDIFGLWKGRCNTGAWKPEDVLQIRVWRVDWLVLQLEQLPLSTVPSAKNSPICTCTKSTDNLEESWAASRFLEWRPLRPLLSALWHLEPQPPCLVWCWLPGKHHCWSLCKCMT